MEWWQTLLQIVAVPLLVATVPVAILFLLQRKGANKKLELDAGSLDLTKFEALNKTYQDLLDRAQADAAANGKAAKEALAELANYQKEREELMETVRKQGQQIERLEGSDSRKTSELADTRDKLERLRSLFTAYVARTGIPMTPEEQAIFEDTKPLFKRGANQGRGVTA